MRKIFDSKKRALYGGGLYVKSPSLTPFFDKVYTAFGSDEILDEIFNTIKESKEQR